MFNREKSLAELQEEDERLDSEISVSRKKVLLKSLDSRMGKNSWKLFSNNGQKSGIDFHRIINWLKNN